MTPRPLFGDCAWRAACVWFVLVISACGSAAQQAAGEAIAVWTDPSPHTSGFITVEPDVRIHYLDWGGTGDALVFLTGIGNTAHSFDELAPRFTDGYRVLAITRRGQGESSRPPTDYLISTLARDVLTVLDSLGIADAHFAAHSFGGQELTRLALVAPRRVKTLVYLDAAFDYFWTDTTSVAAAAVVPVLPAPPGPTVEDCRTVESFMEYSERTFGIRLPEGEVRHTFLRFSDGTCSREGMVANESQVRMGEGVEPQNYRGIRAPALALNAVRSRLSDDEPWKQVNPQWQAGYDSLVTAYRPVQDALNRRFATEVPNGTVVEIQGAHHWIFVSHLERVVAEMKSFLAR